MDHVFVILIMFIPVCLFVEKRISTILFLHSCEASDELKDSSNLAQLAVDYLDTTSGQLLPVRRKVTFFHVVLSELYNFTILLLRTAKIVFHIFKIGISTFSSKLEAVAVISAHTFLAISTSSTAPLPIWSASTISVASVMIYPPQKVKYSIQNPSHHNYSY
jgi:hypothetical protein